MKETPQKVIDFIYQKAGQPTLPKDIRAFLRPELNVKFRTETLIGKIGVNVRYSKGKIEEKIAKVKNYELSDSDKARLLEWEKAIPLREKTIDKPDENRPFFKLEVRPRFPQTNLIRIDTIEGLLKHKKIDDFFGLMKDVWPKPFQMLTCAEYEYETAKFKPTGGFSLPTEIPLPVELGIKFGKPELQGVSMKFKESSMGLEYIEISKENDTPLVVGLRASYQSTLPTQMLKKAYELTKEIAYLLVKKVE